MDLYRPPVLRENLSIFDPKIAEIAVIHGPGRAGDIPHSLADISKAKKLLVYDPKFSFSKGINAAAEWYYKNLRV